MQAQTPEVSGKKANTPQRIRPPMAAQRLDLPSICEICNMARSTRKHAKCSQIRQQRKNAEWSALQAEKAAAKQAKGKRYAR
jgi:hypothetical protein